MTRRDCTFLNSNHNLYPNPNTNANPNPNTTTNTNTNPKPDPNPHTNPNLNPLQVVYVDDTLETAGLPASVRTIRLPNDGSP